MTGRRIDMSENCLGPVGKALAVMCHRCPLCRQARAHPDSLIGRVLHHRLHANYCPLWKAERAIYGADQGRAGSSADR